MPISNTQIESRELIKRSMREAALSARLGWNIRCNLCGTFGAEWIADARPGWGSLCLCPQHKEELIAESRRHEDEMRRLRKINFEQYWDEHRIRDELIMGR